MSLPQNTHIGPCGWSYPHWNGIVYPKSAQRALHSLEYLSQYVDGVEINASFYQPLRPEITRLWMQKAAGNPNFMFSAKLNRVFTHGRELGESAIAEFKDGLWPLLRKGKLGCVLAQFPWSFRYTEENREFVIQLRRAFCEFPMVVEMRHSSWMRDEALGTLIDYNVGFCNIDQAPYTKAMPATALLTSSIGYFRLHGRNPQDGVQAGRGAGSAHEYLYSAPELAEWTNRIRHVHQFAAKTFVFMNNDAGGAAMVNALQLQQMLGDARCLAPAPLLAKYSSELAAFAAEGSIQPQLFRPSEMLHVA